MGDAGGLSDQPGSPIDFSTAGIDDGRDALNAVTCPYGHGTKWIFVRFGREYVCGRCGVRCGIQTGVGS